MYISRDDGVSGLTNLLSTIVKSGTGLLTPLQNVAQNVVAGKMLYDQTKAVWRGATVTPDGKIVPIEQAPLPPVQNIAPAVAPAPAPAVQAPTFVPFFMPQAAPPSPAPTKSATPQWVIPAAIVGAGLVLSLSMRSK